MYKTVDEAVALVKELSAGLGDVSDREVLVCPPFTALYAAKAAIGDAPIALGAQDVYFEEQGAFTGAIAPAMLTSVGASYVIVGHSERRQIFGDDDSTVNKKLHAALKHGLRPILCVGESKPQRDSGEAEAVVVGQVLAGLSGVSASQMSEVVIAYEPIWAIGTGDTATAADAQAIHATIRATLTDLYGSEVAQSVRIQYGGSVKPDNVDELMAQPDIDGALVGGASLDPRSFAEIVKAGAPKD